MKYNQKILATLFILLISITGNARELFDNDWKFSLGYFPSAPSFNFDDSGWRTLDLPHDWSIKGKIEQTNPMCRKNKLQPTLKKIHKPNEPSVRQ